MTLPHKLPKTMENIYIMIQNSNKISYEVAMKVNLWLGVPKTIEICVFSDHDPQVENW